MCLSASPFVRYFFNHWVCLRGIIYSLNDLSGTQFEMYLHIITVISEISVSSEHQ